MSTATEHAAAATEAGPPIRVLFVVAKYPPPVVGGLERQARELAIALASCGVVVTVVTQQLAPEQPEREVLDGVHIRRVRTNLTSRWRPLQLALGVTRVMIEERRHFDVVHLHSISRVGVSAIGLAKLLGKPTLAKLPGAGGSGIPGQVGRSLGKAWLALFRRADAVIAMSAQSVDELRAIGYPEERIVRVQNGVSVHGFSARIRPADASPTPRVVYAGRLLRSKGVLDLIAAWATVVNVNKVNAVLDICGSGPEEPAMRQRVVELGIEGTVAFRGWTDDLAPVLRAADLFVLPSYGEGNSNSVLEAMASGLPVVSTLVGGTPGLVGEEGRQWLVEPGDVRALAQRLTALCLDATTRAQLGQAMRARALTHFDIGGIATRYYEIYRRLVSGRQAAVIVSENRVVPS